MRTYASIVRAIVSCGVILSFVGCGGGGGSDSPSPSQPPSPPPSPSRFTVGGTVTGLAGSGLVLQINGSDDLPLTEDGPFAFSVPLADGSTYEVSVLSQPTNPTQTCTVANASGTLAAANVTNVEVSCATHTHAVRVTVTGLEGTGLTLLNNGNDELPVDADGELVFAERVAEGASYNITVMNPPESPAQSCQVTNGSGTVETSDVTASVTCTTPPLQSLIFRRRTGSNRQADLLIVNEDGTGYLALADSPEEEEFGGITPDGRLVYQRNGAGASDVFSIRLDASELVPLENTTSRREAVAMTVNNRVITQGPKTSSLLDEDLYAVNADGTNEVPLAISSDDEEFKGITPSGRVIYSRTIVDQDDLYAIGADGSDVAQLTDSPQFEEFAAATPGGRVMFYRESASGRDLYSVREDGTGFVEVATDEAFEEFVALLPNERIVFTLERSPGNYDLLAVNADGTALAVLADSSDSEFYIGATEDGRVLFQREVGGQFDVYSILPDGSGLVALADSPDDEYVAAFSAAGQVAIARFDGAQTDLYAVRSDGAGATRLTETQSNEDIFYLDGFGTGWYGERLVFQRETNGTTDLYAIRADGSGLVQLTDTPNENELALATTPSGRVIFRRTSAGSVDLYAVFLDGSGLTRLTNDADPEDLLLVFAASPSHARQVARQLFSLHLPRPST